jgi:CxxC motif-containing protein
MSDKPSARIVRALALGCVICPVCRRARKKQKGAAYWFVTKIEGSACPFGRAYEKVYGRKSHEPVPKTPPET